MYGSHPRHTGGNEGSSASSWQAALGTIIRRTVARRDEPRVSPRSEIWWTRTESAGSEDSRTGGLRISDTPGVFIGIPDSHD